MVTSGVATRKAIDLDFEDESESTVHVMVHDLKPPFLDGKTVYTKQLEPINPIRDPTSDMAIFAKKGSALVKEKREQSERAKAAAKIAGLSGTALGNVMGVRNEEADAEGKSFYERFRFWCKDIHEDFLYAQLKRRRRRRMKVNRITEVILSLHSTLRQMLLRVLSQDQRPSKSKGSTCLHLLVAKT